MEIQQWLAAIEQQDKRIVEVIKGAKTIEALLQMQHLVPDQTIISAKLWSDQYQEHLWAWVVVSIELIDKSTAKTMAHQFIEALERETRARSEREAD